MDGGGYLSSPAAARHRSYADLTVRAVPYDIAITGYGTKNGTPVSWKAEPIEEFDYDAFNSQRFTDAIIDRERTMDIPVSCTPTTPRSRARSRARASSVSFCSASAGE